MATNDSYTLLSLLPSTPYTLAYALPLFLVSLLLTFAGCFLTLDRTRVFSPTSKYQISTSKHRSLLSHLYPLYLEGGIGGLSTGFAFGVHFATLFAVVLPNVSSTSPLGHKTFLAIWVLSALVCLCLGGRWKYAALFLSGISGFYTLALSISVIAHPPLLSRIILSAIFAPLGSIFTLLPFPHCSRIALRIASSSLGAFGVVLSIALFRRNLAWGDIWDRLYLHDSLAWGTSTERGLSAACCLLFLSGMAVDWYLHRRIGENPDEKWDRYLSEYTSDLPNSPHRQGTFTPLVSWWDKLLGRHGPFAPIVPHHDEELFFPSKADVKYRAASPLQSTTLLPTFGMPGKLTKEKRSKPSVEFTSDVPQSKLRLTIRKKRSARIHQSPTSARRDRVIKFDPHSNADASDSDSDSEEGSALNAPSLTDSSATLVSPNSRQRHSPPLQEQLEPPRRPWDIKPGEVPDYSDGEDIDMDITNATTQSAPVRFAARADSTKDKAAGEEVWQPTFIRRHSTSRGPTPPHRQPLRAPTLPVDLPSVPATPSLIKAIQRIHLAQTQPQAPTSSSSPTSAPPQPLTGHLPHSMGQDVEQDHHLQRRNSWDAFWREVKTKARH